MPIWVHASLTSAAGTSCRQNRVQFGLVDSTRCGFIEFNLPEQAGEPRGGSTGPEKSSDEDEALSMLDRSSVAVAKTVTAYPVARTVDNVRTLNREDLDLIEPAAMGV